MTPDQLALFVMESSTNRRKTAIEAGLVKDAPPGAERLLRELVRRGLERDHLHTAAALALVLDEPRRNGKR
jgi:hypothetical protein